MYNVNKFSAYLSLLFICMLFGCKKDELNTPNNSIISSPKGILKLHLHTFVGESEVDAYNIDYLNEEGRKISLNMAQLYISDIQLVKLDGSLCSLGDKTILKFFESETSTVGDVPVGNYKSIRFRVGINSFAGSDSLIFKEPSMWFSSQANKDEYVYLNVQGKIDTSLSLSGFMAPFCYRIGTTGNNIQVIMPDKNFTVLKDQIQYVHMLIDYSKIFNGIQLNNSLNLSVNSINDNSLQLAGQVKNNIPLMFKYE